MKNVRILGATIAMAFAMHTANAQAVRDRNVIPVAVNLNEVLRMTITNGGNIEFVFNSIDDYRLGLGASAAAAGAGATPNAAAPFYRTDFTIASSSRWQLDYGAEEATFIGTDNAANTLALTNVGWTLVSNGVHVGGTEIASVITGDLAAHVSGLHQYPAILMTDNANALANAGDAADNSFTMFWQCGTVAAAGAATTAMTATSILDQNPSPERDRYVVNVIFELSSL